MKAFKFIFALLIFTLLSNVSYGQEAKTPKPRKKKKPGKETMLKKAYHNVTARYNGYYNANLKLTEGKKTLSNQHTDNYNQVLDMYKYMAVPDAKSVAKLLDEAVIKSAVDITLHPNSIYADDCYLLMGQAQYVKQDFENAEKTFDYIISAYDPKNKNSLKNKSLSAKQKKKIREAAKKEKKKNRDAVKKEKAKQRELIREAKKKARAAKKKGDKDATYEDFMPKPKEEKKKKENGKKAKNNPLKHRPIRKDAMVWLARTQIERSKFDEAKIWLNRLHEDKALTKKLKGELAAIDAYLYLKQKNYAAAILPLENAIDLAKKRKQKARYAFILAQIYQLEGQEEKAAATFRRVIKFRPPYEMEFSARLSMIKNADATDPIALAETEKQLKKLLKDEKNEEYQDQIYFTLGEVAFKAKQDNKAIAYLKKSVYYNFGNKGQKAESYLKIADTYYKKENYVDAKYYYDSTLTSLIKTDERYSNIETKSKSLVDIAKNIQVITKQDSFLRIKGLIDDKKEKEYLSIAQKIKDDREKAKAKVKAKKPTLGRRKLAVAEGQRQGRPTLGRQKKKTVPRFWAYESSVDKGKREFKKNWGNDRKLSDNWRRSKRIDANNEIEIIQGEEDEIFDLTTDEAIAMFKKMGVPMDDKGKKTSDSKIIDAMSSLGTLYRERLNNINKSNRILEQLVTRYPKNKYKLESLYKLHIQHKLLKNTSEAEKYRVQVLTEGRNSKFAKAIEDPNFIKGQKSKEVELQVYYNDAYQSFKQGKFTDARDKVDGVESKFGKEYAMKSKFALLGALCTGGIDGVDAYKQSLTEVSSKYKKTPEGEKAQEILNILGGKKPKSSKSKSSGKKKASIDEATGFTINENSDHYIMVIYDKKKLKQTDAVGTVANYNKKYHRLKRLRTSNFLITIEKPTILIRRFKTKKEAMAYVNEVNKNTTEFIGVEDETFRIITINQENYKAILRDRTKWDKYQVFFDKEYMGK